MAWRGLTCQSVRDQQCWLLLSLPQVCVRGWGGGFDRAAASARARQLLLFLFRARESFAGFAAVVGRDEPSAQYLAAIACMHGMGSTGWCVHALSDSSSSLPRID